MATKKKTLARAKEPAKTATAPTGGGSAEDFEKLGVFYLGRPYDLATKQSKPGWLLYDSKDLVTHAVCVGMTGSGKTGLCIGLLEEAAIDGIPVNGQDALRRAVNNKKAGDKMELTIVRNGRTLKVPLTLGAAAEAL